MILMYTSGEEHRAAWGYTGSSSSGANRVTGFNFLAKLLGKAAIGAVHL